MAQAFTAIPPHLAVAQSRLFATNSGLWVAGGEAVLVDPGIYPDEIAAIATWLAEQEAQPRRIVLTHSHWDHILGPEAFPGVPVVAQAEYVPIVRDHGATILHELDEWIARKAVVRDHPFVIPQPDTTFSAATTLAVGGLTLELRHAPGHAPDQLTLFAPASGTLWAADMLSDLEIPFVAHSLEAYIATLDALARLDIRALVPGHGHPTTDGAAIHARLAADRAYLAELHGRVGTVVQAGHPLSAAVAACATLPVPHPATNTDPHRWNVESAYLELGGPGDPRTLGWGQWTA